VAVTAMIGNLSTKLEDAVIEIPSEGIVIARAGHAKATMRAGIEKAEGRSRLIPRGPL
jgi:hypothetical protein